MVAWKRYRWLIKEWVHIGEWIKIWPNVSTWVCTWACMSVCVYMGKFYPCNLETITKLSLPNLFIPPFFLNSYISHVTHPGFVLIGSFLVSAISGFQNTNHIFNHDHLRFSVFLIFLNLKLYFRNDTLWWSLS